MRIRAKYTDSVPVLCTRHKHGGDVLQSPKSKYLIPSASAAHELQAALREDTSHGAAAPLHLYLAGDAAIDPEATLAAIDAASRSADGFLRIWYSSLDAAQLGARRDQGAAPSKLGGTPPTQGGPPATQAAALLRAFLLSRSFYPPCIVDVGRGMCTRPRILVSRSHP